MVAYCKEPRRERQIVAAERRAKDYRLLVVDEKQPLLEVMSSFLTTLGYIVDAAANDSEAQRLKMLEAHKARTQPKTAPDE